MGITGQITQEYTLTYEKKNTNMFNSGGGSNILYVYSLAGAFDPPIVLTFCNEKCHEKWHDEKI